MIAGNARTVLGRASSRAADAIRVRRALLPLQYALEQHVVQPTVAEIIFIFNHLPWFGEISTDRHLPTRQNCGPLPLIRYSNGDRSPTLWPNTERMQMRVKPAHCVLNCNVQPPEDIHGRHLNSAPDRRSNAPQRYLELMNKLYACGFHPDSPDLT